jgi:Carbonic anhydrase
VQVPIESFCFSLTVVQLPFTRLTGLFHQKRNLLKARVVIHAYNHHVRLMKERVVFRVSTGTYMKRAISSIAILPLLILAGPTGHRAIPSGQAHAATSSAQPSVEKIRAELIEGNKRFVAGHRQGSDLIALRRTLAAGQHPRVAVLACSDSRVAPELIFDQGLGELFVVRSAGNVVDPVAIGSIEYAVEHLGSRVIVAMGHTKCGAVTAACSREKMPSANLQAIVDRIDPAVERANQIREGRPVSGGGHLTERTPKRERPHRQQRNSPSLCA